MDAKKKGFLGVFGPAWITIMTDMDAPSTAAAIASGAEFGYHLILLMLILIVPLYLIQEMSGRLGAVTGKGLAFLVREHYGKRWSSLTVGSIFVIDSIAYVGEFAGIVAGGELLGLPLAISLAFAFVFHSLIVLTGGYEKVERALLLVSSFLLLFVVMVFLARPNPSQIVSGLNPFQLYFNPSFAYMAVADIGAVIMPFMIFYQQSAVVDKRLTKRDLKWEKLETFLGSMVTQLLMVSVIIASAAIAARMGGRLNVDGLATVFAALAGRLGIIIFALGLMAAGFLAAVTISLASAYGMGEYFGWRATLNHSNYKSPFYLLYFTEIIPALLIIAWFQRLVPIMIAAMAANGLVLIFPLAFLIKLSGDEKVLGSYKNGKIRQWTAWVIAFLILGFSIFAFVWGVVRSLRFYFIA